MFKKVAKKAEGTRRRVISSEAASHDEDENLPPYEAMVCTYRNLTKLFKISLDKSNSISEKRQRSESLLKLEEQTNN